MNFYDQQQANTQLIDSLKRDEEMHNKDKEIERLRRRIADLEDFLRGAATQFTGMAGR